MKRLKAKEILAESFKELASQKPVEKITIREIAENCGYSSATFYRQFNDKYDLIAWDYSEQVRNNVGKVGKDGYTWKQAFLKSASYSLEQKEYLLNLFKHTSGRYSFEQYMTDVNLSFIKEYMKRQHYETDETMDMLFRVYCYGTIKITIDCLLGKFQVSSSELAEIYEMSVPEKLKKYVS